MELRAGWPSWKDRVFGLLHPDDDDTAAKLLNSFLATLIVANVAAAVMSTVESVQARYVGTFGVFERVSLMVFAVEYAARVWTADVHRGHLQPWAARLRYVVSPLALIDLVALLPLLFGLLSAGDLVALRALRLLRILSLLRLGRYSKTLQLFGRVLRGRAEELFVTVTLVLVLMLSAATLMYLAEREAQPQVYASIPQTMWWAIVTLTTVGYGDMFPQTILGKILGGTIALFGVGLVALPAGLLASGFAEEMGRMREERESEELGLLAQEKAATATWSYCPHCGEKLPAPPSAP
ncbi:ion transporter [Deinococcus yavapaiensis]|uniref:Voltage-gated potassium channel n=1 Tax=Deinococcus yavapaiensis KR-236 TaxID=694435 RepID=A0A318S661_9DEIO|nr:ion transporter [Deinococcus yavapaiensis]PYE53642.1 voltage-gated potassium channel [Deinococcus yavapaiensis KR-236]